MKTLKVGAVSLNQTPLDWVHNLTNLTNAIQTARREQVSILCCPELCITGYGCEDMFLSTATQEMALNLLHELVLLTKNIIVSVGLPILLNNALYNTVCLISNQKILGFVAKQNLANDGVHYEHRWFKPWPSGVQLEIELYDNVYPIGDCIFDFTDFRLGFEICEDAWVANRTGISLVERGVDIILNPSASHFALGKSAVRKRLISEGARLCKTGYLYANLLGNEAGRIIYDGDTFILSNDQILASGPRFSFQDQILITAVLDLASQNSYLKGNNISLLSPTWEEGPSKKEEEFSRAIALGLFDYLRKSKSRGFVLNLSGGADSAACASLVYLMIQLGLQSLGQKKFQEKLWFIFNENNEKLVDPNQLMPTLLYCLYQQTENNSEATWDAAYFLAKSLNIPIAQLSIDGVVKAYTDMIKPLISRPLNWVDDDISLQNIQARVRSPSVWLLANLMDAIVLCTSNRSEASVGYATMDGDTSGGLCPIAGIGKSFILHWLKWLEQTGVTQVGPILGLKKVNAQTPTAELRPLGNQQTDETDLMPYQWLDLIEQLFVRDKLSPLQIFSLINLQYPTESSTLIATYIERFFKYWSINQWKRERLAPAFHIDDHSVDPKTWGRFPILSGGFAMELKTLRKHVKELEKEKR